MCTIRGTDIQAPHGIPVDLLDRLMIIRTHPYGLKDMVHILAIRANVENIPIAQESLIQLSRIAERTSLRYALQLLTPAKILARVNGRDEVTIKELEEVDSLFSDSKSSAKLLEQQKDKYLS